MLLIAFFYTFVATFLSLAFFYRSMGGILFLDVFRLPMKMLISIYIYPFFLFLPIFISIFKREVKLFNVNLSCVLGFYASFIIYTSKFRYGPIILLSWSILFFPTILTINGICFSVRKNKKIT